MVVAGVVVTGMTFGGAGAVGAGLIGAGIGMMVGGIAQMLMPKVDAQDKNQDGNKANKGFGTAVPQSPKAILSPFYTARERLAVLSCQPVSCQRICSNAWRCIHAGHRSWQFASPCPLI